MAIISFACEHGDHKKCPIAGSSPGGPWTCECDCHEPPDEDFDHEGETRARKQNNPVHQDSSTRS
jgi:hypothetical protein